MNEKTGSVTGGQSRRVFDETYKRHAVELTFQGKRPMRAIARELGITEWTLYRWRQRYAPLPGGASGGPPVSAEEKDAQIRRLRAEVIRLREREIVLKKSLGILSETPERGMPELKR